MGKKHCKLTKNGRWSDGFSNTKKGAKDKNNKPKKNDKVEFEDGSVILIDEDVECSDIIGNVSMFAVKGCQMTVNNKKFVNVKKDGKDK